MKFTIKKVNVGSIDVEFANGSTANVLTVKGQTKEEIINWVDGYNNAYVEWESVDDVPVKVGDVLEKEAVTVDENVDYIEARKHHYPGIGNQLDALYWEREGDDTYRKAHDVRIKKIKDTITKDKTYKRTDLDNLLD